MIENAIVHTLPGTTITSRLRTLDGVVTVEVCDTGLGIPMAERGKVFHRFYRLDPSRNTQGADLGLALVAAIASLHRASCDIPGTGSGLCLRIAFPAPAQTLQVTAAP